MTISDQPTDILVNLPQKSLPRVLGDLAANLLRIITGTGQPSALLQQMETCSAAMREYGAAQGCLPSAQVINQILNCNNTTKDHQSSSDNHEGYPGGGAEQGSQAAEQNRTEALQKIRNASLQIAAAMLSHQPIQQERGERNLYDGVELLERAIKKGRRRR
jgi:hypothetical protein